MHLDLGELFYYSSMVQNSAINVHSPSNFVKFRGEVTWKIAISQYQSHNAPHVVHSLYTGDVSSMMPANYALKQPF